MNVTGKTRRLADDSPQTKARLAGLFFLLYIAAGTWAYAVSQRLVVNDTTITAGNVLSSENLFRMAIAANLVAQAFYLIVIVLLYDLFVPVDRTVSRLAAFFNLTSCAIAAFDSVFQLGALDVLKGQYLGTFSVQQQHSLAMLMFRLNVRALDMGQIFFGLQWITIGYLILKSDFLPRFLGVIAAFAGLWYLTRLYPPLVSALVPWSLAVPGVGVILLVLWLAIMGVNAQRWTEQAVAQQPRS